MINKTGLTGLSKNLSKPNNSKDNFNSLASIDNKVIVGRVTDI